MDRKVIPGEYALNSGLRPMEILSRILAGQVVRHSVTIPEGYTVDQIASLLSEKALFDPEEFRRLVTDEDFIKRLNLSVSNLEGYLFPDTYFFTRPIQPQDIIRTFVNRLNEMLTPGLRARAKEWVSGNRYLQSSGRSSADIWGVPQSIAARHASAK